MKDNKRNIDEFFLEELGKATEAPPSSVWDNLGKRLGHTKPAGKPWWFYVIIASVFVGGSIAAYYASNQRMMPKTFDERKNEVAAANDKTISNTQSNTKHQQGNNLETNTTNPSQTPNNYQSQGNNATHSTVVSTANASAKGIKNSHNTAASPVARGSNTKAHKASDNKRSSHNSDNQHFAGQNNARIGSNKSGLKSGSKAEGNSAAGKQNKSDADKRRGDNTYTASNQTVPEEKLNGNHNSTAKSTGVKNATTGISAAGKRKKDDSFNSAVNSSAGSRLRSNTNATAATNSALKNAASGKDNRSSGNSNSPRSNQLEDTFSTAANSGASSRLSNNINNTAAKSVADKSASSGKDRQMNNAAANSPSKNAATKNDKNVAGVKNENSAVGNADKQSRVMDQKSTKQSEQSGKENGVLSSNNQTSKSAQKSAVGSPAVASSSAANQKLPRTSGAGEGAENSKPTIGKAAENSKNGSAVNGTKTSNKAEQPEQATAAGGRPYKETAASSKLKKTVQDTSDEHAKKDASTELAAKNETKSAADKNGIRRDPRKETYESLETVKFNPAAKAKEPEPTKSKQLSEIEKAVAANPLAGAPATANLPDEYSNNKADGQKQEQASGGGGAAAGAKKKEKPKRPLNMAIGLKAGYEMGTASYTARKFVGSAFAEVYFSEKLSFLVQPGIKVAQTNRKSVSSENSYIKPGSTSNTMTKAYTDTAGKPSGFYDYAYSQTYDSIVVSTLTAQRFMEIEVPFLFRYRMNKNFSVIGGMNFVFGKTVGVQNSSKNYTRELTDTVYNVFGTAPAPSSKFSHIGSTPYSSYTDSGAQGQISPVRFGYSVGLSYTFREKLMIDLLIQQNMSGTNSINNDEIRKLFSQPYVRLSLGYVLFGGRKK